MNRSLLITGATSKLGTLFVERLLSSTNYQLWLMVRKNQNEPDPRARMLSRLSKEVHLKFHEKCVVFEGDLKLRQLGIPDEIFNKLCNENVEQVFHLAALTERKSFTKENLFSTNYEGTNRLLNLSQRLRVNCFNYMGQLYTTGNQTNNSSKDYLGLEEVETNFNNINEFVEHIVANLVIQRTKEFSMHYRIFNPAYFLDTHSMEWTQNRWYYNFLQIFYEIKRLKETIHGPNYFDNHPMRFYTDNPNIYLTTTNFVVEFLTTVIDDELSYNKIYNFYSDFKNIQQTVKKIVNELLKIEIEFVASRNDMSYIERKVCSESTVFFEYLHHKKYFEVDHEFVNVCQKYNLTNPSISDEEILKISQYVFNSLSNSKDRNLGVLKTLYLGALEYLL